MTRKHIYLGLKLHSRRREVFTSDVVPTQKTHGTIYAAVIGPFRTKRAAEFMRDRGNNNPHCLCVDDAEWYAKVTVKE